MPLTHVRPFTVRHYECDALGHVYQANYLRYMQEAAFDASAAAGYPLSRYEAMNRLWLVRHTDIEFLHPLRYGDTFEVTTWVADFRRVRSRRAYEFRLQGSATLLACAQTDWAFLDMANERPAAIPDDMMAAFWPESLPPEAPPRRRLPRPPAPPPEPFRQHRRVGWSDLDAARHVNNATYLAYIEDAGIQTAAGFGWATSRLAAEGRALSASKHQIAYHHPALLDDELAIAVWHAAPAGGRLIRHCTIHRKSDAALVVQARSVMVHLDLDTGRPTTMLEPFVEDLRPNITRCTATAEPGNDAL